jgi:hypothetical protein
MLSLAASPNEIIGWPTFVPCIPPVSLLTPGVGRVRDSFTWEQGEGIPWVIVEPLDRYDFTSHAIDAGRLGPHYSEEALQIVKTVLASPVPFH